MTDRTLSLVPAPHPAEPGLSRYAAVAAALRARVLAGEWPPGAALPSEQSLAAQHGIALATLRRALDLLCEQGLVDRYHGKGTFVRQALAGATMLRFFRFGGAAGEVPSSRIVARRKLAATAGVALALGLGPGEQVLQVLRVRALGGTPCLLEEIYLPLPLFSPLAQGPTQEWDALLYPMYAERCAVHVQRATDEIGFSSFSAEQAAHLGLPPGHPCARVTRRALDMAGRCVEVRTSYGDAHAFHYTVHIT